MRRTNWGEHEINWRKKERGAQRGEHTYNQSINTCSSLTNGCRVISRLIVEKSSATALKIWILHLTRQLRCDVKGNFSLWKLKEKFSIASCCQRISRFFFLCFWFTLVQSSLQRLQSSTSDTHRHKTTARTITIKPKQLTPIVAIIAES